MSIPASLSSGCSLSGMYNLSSSGHNEVYSRDNDPDSWARVQLLMDHDQERKGEKEYWDMFQVCQLNWSCSLTQYIICRPMLLITSGWRVVWPRPTVWTRSTEPSGSLGIIVCKQLTKMFLFRTNAFQLEHPYMAAVVSKPKFKHVILRWPVSYPGHRWQGRVPHLLFPVPLLRGQCKVK